VSLRDGGWLKPETVLMLEEGSSAELTLPPGYALEDRREYGAAAVHILSVV
jgi:16S rRNA (guanine966-N2)-methyltransferase